MFLLRWCTGLLCHRSLWGLQCRLCLSSKAFAATSAGGGKVQSRLQHQGSCYTSRVKTAHTGIAWDYLHFWKWKSTSSQASHKVKQKRGKVQSRLQHQGSCYTSHVKTAHTGVKHPALQSIQCIALLCAQVSDKYSLVVKQKCFIAERTSLREVLTQSCASLSSCDGGRKNWSGQNGRFRLGEHNQWCKKYLREWHLWRESQAGCTKPQVAAKQFFFLLSTQYICLYLIIGRSEPRSLSEPVDFSLRSLKARAMRDTRSPSVARTLRDTRLIHIYSISLGILRYVSFSIT